MYGTADGVVHIRRLERRRVHRRTSDVGADAGRVRTPSASPRRQPRQRRVRGHVERGDLGQLFAATTTAPEIEIAQFDEADGSLARQFDVPGTTGMTIDSLAAGHPGARRRRRDLFFVAGDRLFKVPVADAAARASSAPPEHRRRQRQPDREPALANLDVLGTPTPHVAIGTSDGFLRTYRASDLAPGPLIDLKVSLGGPVIAADDVMTPSVPVRPTGALADEAPFVYVAASGVFPFFPPGGRRHDRLQAPRGGWGASSSSSSSCRSRTPIPAPALAVSQLASGADPEDIPDGKCWSRPRPTCSSSPPATWTSPARSTSRAISWRATTASARPRRRPRARTTTSPTTRASRSSAVSATARRCRTAEFERDAANAARRQRRPRPAGDLARLSSPSAAPTACSSTATATSAPRRSR